MFLARAAISAAAILAGAPSLHAEALTLFCKSATESYVVTFDTETKAFVRHVGGAEQSYGIVRLQIERPNVLVWARSREFNGDLLAFFGSRTMVKRFYGNGSETTDACRQG